MKKKILFLFVIVLLISCTPETRTPMPCEVGPEVIICGPLTLVSNPLNPADTVLGIWGESFDYDDCTGLIDHNYTKRIFKIIPYTKTSELFQKNRLTLKEQYRLNPELLNNYTLSIYDEAGNRLPYVDFGEYRIYIDSIIFPSNQVKEITYPKDISIGQYMSISTEEFHSFNQGFIISFFENAYNPMY